MSKKSLLETATQRTASLLLLASLPVSPPFWTALPLTQDTPGPICRQLLRASPPMTAAQSCHWIPSTTLSRKREGYPKLHGSCTHSLSQRNIPVCYSSLMHCREHTVLHASIPVQFQGSYFILHFLSV